ncbi:MAG: CPBP family intramembrane glutamic endopeptidase [Chloroflexota bacterium]
MGCKRLPGSPTAWSSCPNGGRDWRRWQCSCSFGGTGCDCRWGWTALICGVVLALLLPAAVAAVLFLILRPTVTAPETALWLLIPGLAIGSLGEELGWRGYLHKRLDPELRPLISSLLVGMLWGLWHIGSYANGAAYMAFFVLLMIAYSLVLYWLVADRGFNVWIATAFHLSINITNLLFFDMIGGMPFIIASALVWLVVAAALVFWRRDLFFRPAKPDDMGATGAGLAEG